MAIMKMKNDKNYFSHKRKGEILIEKDFRAMTGAKIIHEKVFLS